MLSSAVRGAQVGDSSLTSSTNFFSWQKKASRLKAIASRLEAIASRLEAVASRFKAFAGRLEAIAYDPKKKGILRAHIPQRSNIGT